MCGLVGCAGNLDKKELTALSFLGILSSLRGDNSTGVMDFSPDSQKSIQYSKSTQMPEVFFKPDGTYYNEYYYRRYKNNKPKALAVHTRLATVGTVSKANAHPFLHGDVIGMHNGTIRSPKLANKDRFDTDSEAVIFNLNKYGEEYLEELEDMFDAAYTLVWINTKKHTLNFYRNNQRPLHFFRNYVGDLMYWASDEMWLKSVLPYFDIRGNIVSAAVDTHYVLPLKSKNPVADHTSTVVRKKRVYKSNLPANNSSKVDYDDVSKITDKSLLGTNFPRSDMTVTPARVTHWVGAAGKHMYQDEADRYWQLVAMESQKHHEQKKKDNVIPFDVDEKEVDKRNEAEVALFRFKDEDKDKVIRGQDGKFYFETRPNTYVNESFYRKLLKCGCRGCDRSIRLYDDVLFLTKRDFLCEECKDDNLVKRMVQDEIDDEAWNAHMQGARAELEPNEAEGDEEMTPDEDVYPQSVVLN